MGRRWPSLRARPPAQTSAQATVGTPDAFGGGANSAGYLRLMYWCCFHETGPADIRIEMALDDVRCVPTGARCGTANASGPADYTGDVGFSFTVRLTDHFNPSTWPEPPVAATVQDFTFEHDGWPQYAGGPDGTPCAQSGSTSVGSACNMNTSLDAIIPNAVPDSRRSVWALDAVRIYDGGADGDGDTTADNTVFARPGIFIP